MATGMQDQKQAGTQAQVGTPKTAGRIILRHPRLGDGKDLAAMVDLGRAVHADSLYHTAPYVPAKVERFITDSTMHPDRSAVILAELNGEVIGCLVCRAGELYFSTHKTATCLLFFVKPEHRGSSAAIKLLHGFRRWANGRDISSLYVHVTSGAEIARTDRMLRRLGFQQTGGNYVFVPN